MRRALVAIVEGQCPRWAVWKLDLVARFWFPTFEQPTILRVHRKRCSRNRPKSWTGFDACELVDTPVGEASVAIGAVRARELRNSTGSYTGWACGGQAYDAKKRDRFEQ
jgi:hypothetical protein